MIGPLNCTGQATLSCAPSLPAGDPSELPSSSSAAVCSAQCEQMKSVRDDGQNTSRQCGTKRHKTEFAKVRKLKAIKASECFMSENNLQSHDMSCCRRAGSVTQGIHSGACDPQCLMLQGTVPDRQDPALPVWLTTISNNEKRIKKKKGIEWQCILYHFDHFHSNTRHNSSHLLDTGLAGDTSSGVPTFLLSSSNDRGRRLRALRVIGVIGDLDGPGDLDGDDGVAF